MDKKINVAVLGFGKVATNVIRYLYANIEDYNFPYKLKKVLVKNNQKKREIQLEDTIITDDIESVFTKEIDVVIELIGEQGCVYGYIKRALICRKHVITANRLIISIYGKELLELASQHQVALLFEGAVGCGIPIVNYLKNSYCHMIYSIDAIVNSCSNSIYSLMQLENIDYAQALQYVFSKKYNEADIRTDIFGGDSYQKLSVLVLILYNLSVTPQNIDMHFHGQVNIRDINWAKTNGYVIKQLIHLQQENDKVFLSVGNYLVEQTHLLANIYYNNNAFYIQSNIAGELLFYGNGVHPGATSNSVLMDLDRIRMCRLYERRPFFNVKLNTKRKGKYYLRIPSHIESEFKLVSLFESRKICDVEKNITYIITICSKTDYDDLCQLLDEKLKPEEYCFLKYREC